MPEFDFAGEVFTLTAGAGFDVGIVRSKVGVDARMDFATRFELCHGLSTELSSTAIASGAADLGLLWIIAGAADGNALAAAGVELEGQATIDVFDRVGLSAQVAAFAEATLAGKLSVALDLSDIAAAGRRILGAGPAYQVFLALLRETKIEAGLWGKISCSAMAKSHLNIRGSLADDREAGFVIEQGSEAGLGAGMGYDFYAGVRLENPKRFFLSASETITSTIISEARPFLPRSMDSQLAALEFILPTTLAAAYELGQLAAQEAVASGGAAGETLVGCCLAQLQRFTLDKVGLAAIRVLTRVLDGIEYEIPRLGLNQPQRQALTAALRTIVTAFQGEGLTFPSLHAVLPSLVELLERVRPGARSTWRPLLAAAWLAFAAGDAIRNSVQIAQASASAGAIGLGTVMDQAFLITLPATPDVVREELEPVIGTVPAQMELKAVVDYLIESSICPMLESLVPELHALLGLVSRHTGIKASSLVEVALRASAEDNLTQTELYQAFRAITANALDELVVDDLLPALRAALPVDSDSRIWVDEVAAPSLHMMRDYTLGGIDKLVAGVTTFDDLTTNTLRTGLSMMIGKIVLSNVVVLSDILLDHVNDNLSDAARDLSASVRSGAAGDFLADAEELVGSLIPPLVPLSPNLAPAARELAAELLLALSEATSDQVLTDVRRATRRQLLRRILFSVYGEADTLGRHDVEDFLAEVAACVYLPSPDAVVGLIEAQCETVSAQLAVALPRIEAALMAFFLAVSPAKAIADAVKAEIERQRQHLADLAIVVAALARELGVLAAQVTALTEKIADEVDQVAKELRRTSRRREILDALERDGRAAAARGAEAVVPFYDQMSPSDKAFAREAAAAAFVVAFAVPRMLLDPALQVIAEAADQVSGLLEGSADLTSLLSALSDTVADRVEQEVRSLSGLTMPRELSIGDVARTAALMVSELPTVRNHLRTAFIHKAERNRAIAAQRGKALEQAKQRSEEKTVKERLREARRRGTARVTICSPQRLSSELSDSWAYGDKVPVKVVVENVGPPPSNSAGPPGTLLALNGSPLKVPVGAWTQSLSGRWTLLHTLSSASSLLRPGVNVLECSIADGFNPMVRVAALFLHHASPETDDATTSDENGEFTVRAGRRPVTIDGWTAYHANVGRVPLTGTVNVGARAALADLASAGFRQGQPSLPILAVRPSPETTPCSPAVTVVDDHHRWRGDLIPKRP